MKLLFYFVLGAVCKRANRFRWSISRVSHDSQMPESFFCTEIFLLQLNHYYRLQPVFPHFDYFWQSQTLAISTEMQRSSRKKINFIRVFRLQPKSVSLVCVLNNNPRFLNSTLNSRSVILLYALCVLVWTRNAKLSTVIRLCVYW